MILFSQTFARSLYGLTMAKSTNKAHQITIRLSLESYKSFHASEHDDEKPAIFLNQKENVFQNGSVTNPFEKLSQFHTLSKNFQCCDWFQRSARAFQTNLHLLIGICGVN
jgi:hypothetical protein